MAVDSALAWIRGVIQHLEIGTVTFDSRHLDDLGLACGTWTEAIQGLLVNGWDFITTTWVHCLRASAA
jgi:hypothetical protein